MTDTPRVFTDDWPARLRERAALDDMATRLRNDGHTELAETYRLQARALSDAAQTLQETGGAIADVAKKQQGSSTTDRQKLAVDVGGWLLAYGWTPPADLDPLLIDAPEADTDQKGEADA